MIRVETDAIGTVKVKPEADFEAIMEASADVQEFTANVAIELKSTVLAAIVATQDEYINIIQSKKQIPVELRSSLKEMVFSFVQEIDQEEIDSFRETVTG